MKTKIIYISGGEIFDMLDIRTALDQVREALGLGSDTVLFGVPVDKASALDKSTKTIESVTVTANVVPDVPEIIPDVPQPVMVEPTTEPVDIIETDTSDIAIETETVTVENVTPPKKSRGRPKSAKKTVEHPVAIEKDIAQPESEKEQNTEKVVSILSVLTAKTDDTPVADTADITDIDVDMIATPIADTTPETDVADEVSTEPEITDIIEPVTEIEDLPVTDITDDVIDATPIEDEMQSVSIDDMITDDAPVVPQEKTLEQLLESMAPLREDIEHEQHIEESGEIIDTPVTDAIDMSADDDATLEQLATEFAENQDKITTVPKTENHGKIGKLKNILPFKKARRDDASLMGDLFGWAGIAANDEDFAIPGFFTNAASKK